MRIAARKQTGFLRETDHNSGQYAVFSSHVASYFKLKTLQINVLEIIRGKKDGVGGGGCYTKAILKIPV